MLRQPVKAVSTRAVVATLKCLSTVAPPTRDQGVRTSKPFLCRQTGNVCRRSQFSRLSRHCRDRVSTTALVFTYTQVWQLIIADTEWYVETRKKCCYIDISMKHRYQYRSTPNDEQSNFASGSLHEQMEMFQVWTRYRTHLHSQDSM